MLIETRHLRAVSDQTEDDRITTGRGEAHDERLSIVAERQEDVDDEEDVCRVSWPQGWQLCPMVERLDHVDADEDEDDDAGGDERNPGTLSHDFLTKCNEQGGPDDENTGQVCEDFDSDR